MSCLRLPRLSLFALGLALALISPAMAGVLPVSPGAADRLVEVTSACPTFAWSGVEGAVAYELAVFDLVDGDDPRLVYSRRIEGAAFAWAPSREECLTPGRVYAWLVRADVAESGLSDWSAPRRFLVPGAPTGEELSAALAVLERWQATRREASGPASGSLAAGKSTAASGADATAETEVPLAAGVAAIRGEIPDVTGNAYGVLGITSSPQGAGVVARNQSAGPDLILDGEAQGEPDTVLNQGGLDRPSASGATFNFQNSGAGALTLQVDGVAVDTANTPIAWGRLASVPAGFADGVDNNNFYVAGNQLSLNENQFNVSEGPHSGLDADTLDGLDSGAYAPWPHLHPGEVIASGTVAEAWIASALARDSEVMPLVLAGDGSGSGLDADTVDGLHAADLQALPVGLCPAGQAVRGINPDGSLNCYEVPLPPKIAQVDDSADFVGQFTSLAMGSDGFPVISYHNSTLGTLLVAKCNDASCAGADETITTVDDPANSVGQYTSIAIGADGFPVISYLDNTAHALKVAKCNDAACAGANETITTIDDPANYVGPYTSIAIGADGFPVISYQDTSAAALKVAKCNNAACTLTTISTVDDPPNAVGMFTSIAIGADGFPVISYRDVTAYSLKVAKCNDSACAGANETITTVDDPPTLQRVGAHTSIAVGTDGFPVISYTDTDRGVLKVAKCNDPACAGGGETISDVDDAVIAVGYDTSIVIGDDGFPVISYAEANGWGLRVAKCQDAACTLATISVVDDSADHAGSYTSIAIGTDGFPVISYQDSDHGSLKVAKCRNPSCFN